MVFLAGCLGGIIGGLVVVVLLPRKKCPDCGAPLPKLRNCWDKPGTTKRCRACACLTDGNGLKVVVVRVADGKPGRPEMRSTEEGASVDGCCCLQDGMVIPLVAEVPAEEERVRFFWCWSCSALFAFVGDSHHVAVSFDKAGRGAWRVFHAEGPDAEVQTAIQAVSQVRPHTKAWLNLDPRIRRVPGD